LRPPLPPPVSRGRPSLPRFSSGHSFLAQVLGQKRQPTQKPRTFTNFVLFYFPISPTLWHPPTCHSHLSSSLPLFDLRSFPLPYTSFPQPTPSFLSPMTPSDSVSPFPVRAPLLTPLRGQISDFLTQSSVFASPFSLQLFGRMSPHPDFVPSVPIVTFNYAASLSMRRIPRPAPGSFTTFFLGFARFSSARLRAFSV